MVGLAVVLYAAPTVAETVAEQSKRLFEEGLAFKDAGNSASACDRFAKSHALVAAPGAAEQLGECMERDGKFYQAWQLYIAARDAWSRDDKVKGTKLAGDHADRVEHQLVTIIVRVADPTLAGLTITLGDHRVAPIAEINERANPGDVEVTAAAPDRRPFSEHRVGAPGSTVVIEVPVLAKIDSAGPPTRKPSRRRTSRVYLAVGLGVAGVGVGVGGVLEFLDARAKKRAGDDATATHKADIATGLGVAAVALGAAAIYTYVTAPRDAVVVPVASDQLGGLAITGRF